MGVSESKPPHYLQSTNLCLLQFTLDHGNSDKVFDNLGLRRRYRESPEGKIPHEWVLFTLPVERFANEDDADSWDEEPFARRLGAVTIANGQTQRGARIRVQDAVRIPLDAIVMTLAFVLGHPLGWSLTYVIQPSHAGSSAESVTITDSELKDEENAESLEEFARHFGSIGNASIRFHEQEGREASWSLDSSRSDSVEPPRDKPSFPPLLSSSHLETDPKRDEPSLLPLLSSSHLETESPRDRLPLLPLLSSSHLCQTRRAERERAEPFWSATGSEDEDCKVPGLTPNRGPKTSLCCTQGATISLDTHLVPQSLSDSHLTWLMACMERSLPIDISHYTGDQESLGWSLEAVLRSPLDYSTGVIVDTGANRAANRIIPLSPALHEAFVADKFLFNGFCSSLTWVSANPIPLELLERSAETGEREPSTNATYGVELKGIFAAVFASSAKTLYARFGSPTLKGAFLKRAGEVVRYREVQKAREDAAGPIHSNLQGVGESSAAKMNGVQGAKHPYALRERKAHPTQRSDYVELKGDPEHSDRDESKGKGRARTSQRPGIKRRKSGHTPQLPTTAAFSSTQDETHQKTFEKYWISCGGSSSRGRRTRRWVLDARKLATLVADQRKEMYTAREPDGWFLIVSTWALRSLVCSKSPASKANRSHYRASCVAAGVHASRFALAVQDHIEWKSYDDAAKTFVRLSAEFDADVFFLAWPTVLSQEAHLLE